MRLKIYCDECKENLCMQCDMEHNNNHKIISYRDIYPNNIENIRNKMKELKAIIDKFNKNIDEIIILLKNLKDNIEKFYMIFDNILNNYDINNSNRNYQILYNLNIINNINDNKIINEIKEIINENNIVYKFNKIFNLENIINAKDKEIIRNKDIGYCNK